MQGLIRRAYAVLWSVALLLLVLLALYASLGRQYIGLVSRYQSDIFVQLEGLTGIPLAAEKLEGSWSGLSPVLNVSQLDIGNGAIIIDQARVVLDPIGSLLGAAPRLKQLKLSSLTLHLHQDDGGRWYLPGISTSGGGGSFDSLLDLILAVRRASMQHLDLYLHFSDGSQSRIQSEDFSWLSDGEFRRSYANLRADDSGEIQLLAEALGDPRDRRFSATAYIALDSSRFSALAPLFNDQALIHSKVDGQLWLEWEAGRRMGITGELSADNLAIGSLWGSDESFQNVQMVFNGRHQNGFWRAGFSRFAADWREQELSLDGLLMSHPDVSTWQFSLPSLALDSGAELLRDSGALSDSLTELLNTLQPGGKLERVSVDLKSGEQPEFALRSELHGLRLSPWHGAPGVTGLSGYLEVTRDRGRLLIDSDALELSFPDLYPAPFQLTDFSTELQWQIADQRLALHSGPIVAKDGESPLRALLRLDLPFEAGAEVGPAMTLAVSGTQLSLATARRYAPDILSDGLLAWLDGSLKAGVADRAEFIYRGSLRADEHDLRTVQLALDVSELSLQFQTDWPALNAARAAVYLDDGQLWGSGDGMTINGIALSDVAVSLAPNERDIPQLNVGASARASFAEVQALFRDSPIGALSGNVIDGWRGEGESRAKVSVKLPLEGRALPAVEVEADINLPLLWLPDIKLSLSQITGPLYYSTEKGLRSPSLRGRLFGEALKASIRQEKSEVRIDASSMIDAADVQRWLDQPAMGFLQGRTRVDMVLRAGADQSGVEIRSDMQGISVRLPQPLYKASNEPLPLRVNAGLGSDAPPLTVALGELFQLHYQQRGDESAVAIALGKGASAELRGNTVSVTGTLDFAAMDQWQLALTRFLELQNQKQHNTGSGESLPVIVDRLQVGELDALGQMLHDAVISARSDESVWTLRVDSRELAGNIEVPMTEAEPYVLMFERLALPALSTEQVAGESGLASVDPRSLPILDVDIEQLSLGGKDYGRVGFDLRPDARGAHFVSLRGQLLGVDLGDAKRESQLHWWVDDSGEHRSQLRGKFAVRDLGEVLKRLDYDKALETTSGSFDLNLSWPGAPDAWQMSESQGRLRFLLKNGRFLKSSDAASGTLRALSIFNMANIVRRLKFDFRDVFSKGIHFDEMKGELGFANQRLYLTEPMDVSGPSSRFQMSGNINLLNEALDMRLVATLPVGSNLPWVAALVGGLPAAAGAFVVTKVFEEQVDSFSSAVYDIGGTVQKPELSFERIFDASESGPKSVKEASK